MAIVRENLAVRILTRMNYGIVDGKEVIRSRSYADVRPTASDESIHQIAQMIGDIQVPALETIRIIGDDMVYDDGL